MSRSLLKYYLRIKNKNVLLKNFQQNVHWERILPAYFITAATTKPPIAYIVK